VGLVGDQLKEAVVAQQVGVVLILVAGDEGVETLDDQREDGVDDVSRMTVVSEAPHNAPTEADQVVELAEHAQARVGGDAASVKLHLEFFIVAEGEVLLDVALCTHGRSLPKRRYGLPPRYFDAPAVFLSLRT